MFINLLLTSRKMLVLYWLIQLPPFRNYFEYLLKVTISLIKAILTVNICYAMILNTPLVNYQCCPGTVVITTPILSY